MYKPRICRGEYDAQNSSGVFWIQNGSLNLSQTTRPANQRVKIERKRKIKIKYLAKELKERWTMKVTVIPIVIDTHGTVAKRIATGT